VFLLLILLLAANIPTASAQTFLAADGKTDAYTLIRNALGGPRPIEPPDCAHSGFGPHITQAPAAALAKSVFVFHLHVTPDNDRCINFDRQRIEIKTYAASPNYLKAFIGETTVYRWRFALDEDFQPSTGFTHVHQLKAGDGDADDPLVTLAARGGNPEKLELIHVDSKKTRSVAAAAALAGFKGVWVEAYEKVTWAPRGAYSLEIRRLGDGVVLFSYANGEMDLWRKGAAFSRPKWGIYRSLANRSALRDEKVWFDGFCLAKGSDDCRK
jgi:hypothetical protein